MSHRKKNKNDLTRFLKYTGNGMKGKERNSFERELQRDPFEAEAAEGFSMVTAGEAEKDMRDIRKRLADAKKKRRILTPMRIAAALALLIGTTALLLLLRHSPEPPLVSQAIEQKKTTVAAESKPETKTAIEENSGEGTGARSQAAKMSVPVVVSDTLKNAVVINPTGSETVIERSLSEARENEVITTSVDKKEMLSGKVAGLEVHEANMNAMEKSTSGDNLSGKRIISGTIISTDDQEPLPGASVVIKGTARGAVTDINGKFSIDAGTDSSLILVASFIGMEQEEIKSKPDTNLLIALNSNPQALDEVVVVGYGTVKKQDVTGSAVTVNMDETKSDYNKPEPSVGYKEFNKYIETNIHYPAGAENKTREVVVLGVTILTNGNISNIRVIKSPSQAFSDEAIRLVKEGPSWKAATMKGIPLEEDIRVRIVFKPR
ncbi:MAG TPA: carboxypeptidase-like regulatory domain-containing protein [Bacteroidales bacterium]|nr:carboxypeptidase-like regulatory domain-containing protein [Bacteroidales bacterium]HPT12927.1 carboxypeptidase-like regulatory domain-containing protein [Bacteroidales bacterium]